jgi:nitrogen regulatory protein PII
VSGLFLCHLYHLSKTFTDYLNQEGAILKKIEAIIRPEKFNVTKDTLEENGYGGMSVLDVKGQGHQKGKSEIWRGKRYRANLLPKTKIVLIVADEELDKAVEAIISSSQTGSLGDGIIFVSDVAKAYRIRTGEQGNEAI